MEIKEAKQLLWELRPAKENVKIVKEELDKAFEDLERLKKDFADTMKSRDKEYEQAFDMVVSNLNDKIEKYFSKLKTEFDTKSNKLDSVISDIKSKGETSEGSLHGRIKETKSEIDSYVKSTMNTIDSLKKETYNTISEVSKEMKDAVKETRENLASVKKDLTADIVKKFTAAASNQAGRGGAMSRQLSVSSTVIANRYKDVNIIPVGITITTANNDTTKKTDVTISSGSSAELPATGTINSVNTAFTFTQQPTYIVSDGVWYKVNVGWTWNGGTLTATMSVPPNDNIWGVK